jgi:hypothetical protein
MNDGTVACLIYSGEYCLSVAAKRPIFDMFAAMLPKSALSRVIIALGLAVGAAPHTPAWRRQGSDRDPARRSSRSLIAAPWLSAA